MYSKSTLFDAYLHNVSNAKPLLAEVVRMYKDAMELEKKKCVPCEGGIPPLKESEMQDLLGQINNSWEIIDGKYLSREFVFVNFKHTMKFVDLVASLAEEEGHHPVMHVYFSKCVIELWTHAINGISENDFILAAKIDKTQKAL